MGNNRRNNKSKSRELSAAAESRPSRAGKATFAITIAAVLILMGTLSYIYLNDTQDPYSGSPDSNIGDITPLPTVELAPDFNYQAINGGYVSLAGLRGDVVILDFMAMWCQPCGTQMEILNDIYTEYASKGVTIVSIDVDTSEAAPDLLAYKTQKGATWDFVFDTGGISFNPKYDAGSIPTIIIIKKDGSIAQRYVGVTGFDIMKYAIDPLL
ncbi:MAG: TlpA family protein disulfide reductase [Candidatus Thermoplasmatota archaeon]|nr:TlpA family protein disulfide reductase [Euryarchaeota archaeon]MBU4032203.1 TlpA family protein disulfide reductase [Candidatus Thermoplasmatota archaeon]MBU4071815.1 TlpA family protein disulfide reductase [Candidatus Thermoplasmatota archaeon]MBU4143948.1 TlpA family protein disulfide reductase [Candidatus Thermoplasmatota archaeon]MBU4592555.1 TlpA family protein disulfide reductase [Candidatus Thermoplasmatota archaeon]